MMTLIVLTIELVPILAAKVVSRRTPRLARAQPPPTLPLFHAAACHHFLLPSLL